MWTFTSLRSHCWLTPAHPDPLGEQLISLADCIELAEKGVTSTGSVQFPPEAGIFVDFGSLYQKDPELWHPCCSGPTFKVPELRTAAEAAAADAYEASRVGKYKEAFGIALSSMQIWYAHTKLYAFLTRKLPKGYETIAGYRERGWPTCESSWVALAKTDGPGLVRSIIDVGATWENGRTKDYTRPAPLAPMAMARVVARKKFTSKKADLPMVIALNTLTIVSLFTDVDNLTFNNLDWTDDEVEQLVQILPLCKSLKSIGICLNISDRDGVTVGVSDRGAQALAAAFRVRSTVPNLEELWLGMNLIEEDGSTAIAAALAQEGVLPKLKFIQLDCRLQKFEFGRNLPATERSVIAKRIQDGLEISYI